MRTKAVSESARALGRAVSERAVQDAERAAPTEAMPDSPICPEDDDIDHVFSGIIQCMQMDVWPRSVPAA